MLISADTKMSAMTRANATTPSTLQSRTYDEPLIDDGDQCRRECQRRPLCIGQQAACGDDESQ